MPSSHCPRDGSVYYLHILLYIRGFFEFLYNLEHPQQGYSLSPPLDPAQILICKIFNWFLSNIFITY